MPTSPLSPGGPASPVPPVGPGGPAAPGTPLAPSAPAAPLRPDRPSDWRTRRSSHANLALRSRWTHGASLSTGSRWPRRPGSADVALGSLRTRRSRVAFGSRRPRRTGRPGSALLSFWPGLTGVSLVSLGASGERKQRDDGNARNDLAHSFPPVFSVRCPEGRMGGSTVVCPRSRGNPALAPLQRTARRNGRAIVWGRGIPHL